MTQDYIPQSIPLSNLVYGGILVGGLTLATVAGLSMVFSSETNEKNAKELEACTELLKNEPIPKSLQNNLSAQP